MSDVTIPEDVMHASLGHLAAALMAAEPGGVVSSVDVIARAILAEREACAAHLETLVATREEAGIKRAKDYILACAASIRRRGAQAIRSSHE